MSEATTTADAPTPAGLGGWLTLVGFGLIVAPLRLTVFLIQTYPPLFKDGTWEALTTPGTEAYHALWAPLLSLELVSNAAFIVAALVLLLLFFKRSRRFPRLFVVYAVANLSFILGDAWLGSFVLADEPIFDPDTAREFGRSLVGGIIWIPYMLVSKRVRNTFVE